MEELQDHEKETAAAPEGAAAAPTSTGKPNPVLGLFLGLVGCLTTFFAIAGIGIVSKGTNASGPVGMLVVVAVMATVFYLCRRRPIALSFLLGMGLVHVAYAVRFLSVPAAYRPSLAGGRLLVGVVVALVAGSMMVLRAVRNRHAS